MILVLVCSYLLEVNLAFTLFLALSGTVVPRFVYGCDVCVVFAVSFIVSVVLFLRPTLRHVALSSVCLRCHLPGPRTIH